MCEQDIGQKKLPRPLMYALSFTMLSPHGNLSHLTHDPPILGAVPVDCYKPQMYIINGSMIIYSVVI